MSNLDKEAERLRQQARKLEEKAKHSLTSIISDSKWTSSKLWITIGAIVALLLMRKMGLDLGDLADLIVVMIIALLFFRTVNDVSRDWARVALAWISARYDKPTDPASDPDANK